jgi:hypothetical protein
VTFQPRSLKDPKGFETRRIEKVLGRVPKIFFFSGATRYGVQRPEPVLTGDAPGTPDTTKSESENAGPTRQRHIEV